MIRAVIDTNVFVSSFFGGNPRKIIDLWKNGEITLCLSRPIVEEYVAVLQRLGLQDARELEELLALFARGFHCLFAAQPPALQIVADDPDDNKFIECAVALKSPCIISGDNHLRSIGSYMEIRIVSPREFLEMMAKGK
ncbi:MAG: putative toxin-antitoxin system toxin component, PIN family [Desulfobacteraceae bacterium]|nr:putative toxin-antitoxin system toxin component, PIN family [Desulfobacteraceae bacterium]